MGRKAVALQKKRRWLKTCWRVDVDLGAQNRGFLKLDCPELFPTLHRHKGGIEKLTQWSKSGELWKFAFIAFGIINLTPDRL